MKQSEENFNLSWNIRVFLGEGKMIEYLGENEGRVEGAMSVIAGWIARNRNIRILYHDGNEVDADIQSGTIRIPKLACSSGISHDALMLLRVHVYHEARHIVETKLAIDEMPRGPLFDIFNALEDRRIEWIGGHEQDGERMVFRWGNRYYNKKIAENFEGRIKAPLWEALSAMGLQSIGETPAWHLSEKSQIYFDRAYDTFTKWYQCKTTKDILALASEVYDLLKEEKKEEKSRSEKGKSGEGEKGKDESNSKRNDESEKNGKKEEERGESEEGGQRTKGESDSGMNDDGELKSQKKPSDEDVERELEEELEGKSFDDILKDGLKKEFKKLPDEKYTSVRDKDEHKIPDSGADREDFLEERKKMRAGVAAMTRALEQALRAMARVRREGYKITGQLDKRRLAAVAKSTSKHVFFQKKNGTHLNTVVEIIIDESGSMVRYCDDVRLLVIALGETLDQIGIPFEITGTTTKCGGHDVPPLNGFTRTNPIIYKHYKRFKDTWAQVRHRVVNIGAFVHHNVDGEVVEYGAFRLAERKEKRKVIFSLCDGLPCAGHNNDITMGKNLKNVCQRVRRLGIEVYGFGIGTFEPSRFYGKDNFIFLETAKDIGQEFVKEFVRIVRRGNSD